MRKCKNRKYEIDWRQNTLFDSFEGPIVIEKLAEKPKKCDINEECLSNGEGQNDDSWLFVAVLDDKSQ